MVKVIREGRYIKRPLQFVCSECLCHFESDEYNFHKIFAQEDLIVIDTECPDCHNTVNLVITDKLLLR